MNNLQKFMDFARDNGPILVTSEVNRLYATGFAATDGMLLVTAERAWFMTDSRYTEAAEKTIEGAQVVQTSNEKPYHAVINEITERERITSLGFESDRMTYAEFARLSEKLTCPLKSLGSLVSHLRAQKTAEELECLIRAQRLAEKSFREVLPLVVTGLTEKQLAAKLMCAFYENGAEDKSFDPIVVSAERTSMPHGVPTDAVIGNGFLTMDFGVKLGGWCSDTTRTVCIGRPTDEMVNVYETVRRAQLAGIAAARAGVTGKEVDGAARRVIADAGYGEYFGHSFGHSLGLEIHEPPNASPTNEEPLPEGAVISAEPGIYIPGKFGVRIEDVLYLTAEGSKNITELPKELIIL